MAWDTLVYLPQIKAVFELFLSLVLDTQLSQFDNVWNLMLEIYPGDKWVFWAQFAMPQFSFWCFILGFVGNDSSLLEWTRGFMWLFGLLSYPLLFLEQVKAQACSWFNLDSQQGFWSLKMQCQESEKWFLCLYCSIWSPNAELSPVAEFLRMDWSHFFP